MSRTVRIFALSTCGCNCTVLYIQGTGLAANKRHGEDAVLAARIEGLKLILVDT